MCVCVREKETHAVSEKLCFRALSLPAVTASDVNAGQTLRFVDARPRGHTNWPATYAPIEIDYSDS